MDSELIPINKIKPYASNLSLKAIILTKTTSTRKNSNLLWEILIADSSASIVMSVFSQEIADLLNEGDIILVRKATVRFYGGELRLRLFAREIGYVFKIDEFCMLFNQELNVSLKYKMESNTKLMVVKKPPPPIDPQLIPTPKRKINYSADYFNAYKKPKLESIDIAKGENELTVKEKSPTSSSRISVYEEKKNQKERMEHLRQRFR